MIVQKKKFTLCCSELSSKFRVENNNLDISALIQGSDFRACSVSDIAHAHRNDRKKKATASAVFRYVEIGDLDVGLGRIKSYREFTGAEAPNNARRIMKAGDVLISTRRPTRGACAVVPDDFDGHICTVFFTTLRVDAVKEVDPGYLAVFLRTSLARVQFEAMITETAYPVITDEDVESLTVLLPDIEMQRRIAREYDDAVCEYIRSMNLAYTSIAAGRSRVESSILGEYGEEVVADAYRVGQSRKADS